MSCSCFYWHSTLDFSPCANNSALNSKRRQRGRPLDKVIKVAVNFSASVALVCGWCTSTERTEVRLGCSASSLSLHCALTTHKHVARHVSFVFYQQEAGREEKGPGRTPGTPSFCGLLVHVMDVLKLLPCVCWRCIYFLKWSCLLQMASEEKVLDWSGEERSPWEFRGSEVKGYSRSCCGSIELWDTTGSHKNPFSSISPGTS